jgi:predicted naringenin-chalcone synthase
MARVLSTATAVPPYKLERAWYRRRCEEYFAPAGHAAAARRIIDGTCIDARYLSLPPERLVEMRSLDEKSADYERMARGLCEAVARRALDRAQVDARAVDLIVTTSCTGLMIPSVDAYLVDSMRLRRDVVRLPITELGCAGGAAALARAREHLLAFPDHTVLVVAFELPSLTFQPDDLSLTNLVATSLFGDGAAAVVLGGGGARRPSPRILDSRTWLYPDSTHLMGFQLKEHGLHIVLDRDVPRRLEGQVRPLVEALLADHGLSLADVRFTVIHPGGRRILEDLDRDLGVGALTVPSWEVLRRYGNLSSATVLFVLDDLLGRAPPPVGAHGILAAFGPGFSCELSLLRWEA